MNNQNLSIQTKVEVVMCIEGKTFEDITKELKGLNFALNKDGFLVYNSPFVNPGDKQPLIFKFKPLTEGSKIYRVCIEGQMDGIRAILETAFSRYNVNFRMLQFDVELEDYSVAKCQNMIAEDTNWGKTEDARIFNVASNRNLACLLMDTSIKFQTRDKLDTFEQVGAAIQECKYQMDVFVPTTEFNLFTFEEVLSLSIA
ncbi:hypothetical protein [Solibacillus sp. NPDC093137]|uniref:hypothetical protein n=1 Tax=Solibacillus sp. NPDC093137 TaxID=3390678 RepID=UPI003D026EE1